jgi:NADH-quinone oxidoreductase subunit E
MSVDPKQVKKTVGTVLKKFQHDKSLLVSIFQDIQKEYNYLPQEAIVEVSKRLDIPMTQAYSVATFFKAFSLKPRARHIISVCLGTACHVRGSVKVLEKIERELGIKSGENTPDMKFTLESVRCVGACALGPMVLIDGKYHGEMTTDKVVPMLQEYA